MSKPQLVILTEASFASEAEGSVKYKTDVAQRLMIIYVLHKTFTTTKLTLFLRNACIKHCFLQNAKQHITHISQILRLHSLCSFRSEWQVSFLLFIKVCYLCNYTMVSNKIVFQQTAGETPYVGFPSCMPTCGIQFTLSRVLRTHLGKFRCLRTATRAIRPWPQSLFYKKAPQKILNIRFCNKFYNKLLRANVIKLSARSAR